MKHYIRPDGNGGAKISGSMIALLTLLLLALGMLGSSVLAYGRLNEKVDNIEEQFADIGEIEDGLSVTSTKVAVVESRLDSIDRNLEEIKAELRLLREDLANK